MDNIRVSVAMATYNGAAYIVEQISSILKCLAENDELVISDDGSSDNTVGIIRDMALKDDRIKLYAGPHDGVVKNFENALMHCSGNYIFLSDQDDVWHPDKVSRVLPELNEYILVCHNANIYNSLQNKIEGDVQSKIGCRKTVAKNIIKNSFMGCCMAFQRKLLDFALPFPSQNEIHIHDWWLGLIAIRNGKVFFEKQCLIDYRIHDSNTLGFKKSTLLFKIRKRINMIKALKKYKKRHADESIKKNSK